MKHLYVILIALAVLAVSSTGSAQTSTPAATQEFLRRSAPKVTGIDGTRILAAARAGQRIVAAGELGTILLSDDSGKTYRQAVVPVSVQLTALYFVDDRRGWAVGHGGVILNTTDGGDNWILQHARLELDQPLFSVYFPTAEEGWAVGLWSLVLHTRDAGKTWNQVSLPVPPGARRSDLNLFKVFGGPNGDIYVAAEKGFVLKFGSNRQWEYLATGYSGSLWTGVTLPDATIVVGGLRGSLYRSVDGGRTWSSLNLTEKSSITLLVREGAQTIYGAGFDGLQFVSEDGGLTFKADRRQDRLSLTALVPAPAGKWLAFSTAGIRVDGQQLTFSHP